MQTARTSPAGSGLECPWERGREQLCHQGQPGTATSLQAEQGSGAALASPGAAPGARGSFPHTVHKSLPCRSSALHLPMAFTSVSAGGARAFIYKNKPQPLLLA